MAQFIIRKTKVYGELRTQIPTAVARQWGLADGDKVVWIAENGTVAVKPETNKFRSIA